MRVCVFGKSVVPSLFKGEKRDSCRGFFSVWRAGEAEENTLTYSAGPSNLISEKFLKAEVTEAINEWKFRGRGGDGA